MQELSDVRGGDADPPKAPAEEEDDGPQNAAMIEFGADGRALNAGRARRKSKSGSTSKSESKSKSWHKSQGEDMREG